MRSAGDASLGIGKPMLIIVLQILPYRYTQEIMGKNRSCASGHRGQKLYKNLFAPGPRPVPAGDVYIPQTL